MILCPPLHNTVLPCKIFTIYDSNGREVYELPADNALDAVQRAKPIVGRSAKMAIIKIPVDFKTSS